jgi:hypothetical protein
MVIERLPAGRSCPPTPWTAALKILVLVAREAGELDRALDLPSRALAVCAAEGDGDREAALENNLPTHTTRLVAARSR